MDIAALILWIITAAGGFYLLATWIGKGGMKQQSSKFPPALVFGHFLSAALGLVVWIIYLVTDSSGWAWTALVLLLVIALQGFGLFAKWLPGYRAKSTAAASGPGATSADETAAEQHFPVVVVAAHGLLAVGTLLLVLVTVLQLS